MVSVTSVLYETREDYGNEIAEVTVLATLGIPASGMNQDAYLHSNETIVFIFLTIQGGCKMWQVLHCRT